VLDFLRWGEETTGQWTIKEDNRKADLYSTTDGGKFEIGENYNGLGPVPAWLTTIPRPSALHTWVDGAWFADQSALDQLAYEQTKAQVDAKVASETARASTKILPLQDAVDLGIATEQETIDYNAWRTYRVLVSSVPTQAEYPLAVAWPIAPDA